MGIGALHKAGAKVAHDGGQAGNTHWILGLQVSTIIVKLHLARFIAK